MLDQPSLRQPEPSVQGAAPKRAAQGSTTQRPALWRRVTAGLLIATLQISAFAQAVGPMVHGAGGRPYTGYTKNGTYMQSGAMVGNPHQIEHDLLKPGLWTTAAVSYTNSTDPSFGQITLGEMETDIAVTPVPGGKALSRLYLTPTNPYLEANAGAPGCNAATTCNQAVYNQILLDAAATGYVATADDTHIGRTHPSSSNSLGNRGFNAYHTKPVFLAAQDPNGGATAFFALQGPAAVAHLAALQNRSAAQLGGLIFFSQQSLKGPGSGGPPSYDFEGNRYDPGADFDAALGSMPSNNSDYASRSPANGFQIGYIQPDGQAHSFDLIRDQHFKQFQNAQGFGAGEWGTDLNTGNSHDNLLGANLRNAGLQNQKGQQAVANIDFGYFKEDRALFLQGINLYGYGNKADNELLRQLEQGQIAPGHPEYNRVRGLAEERFKVAYAAQAEYNLKAKFSKEAAKYQSDQLELGRYNTDKLFNSGLNLFDKKGDSEQERLLGMLQRGELKAGDARFDEIRGLAEARYKIAYQKALEPPKKANWVKTLVAVVIAAVVVYFTAGAASVWAAGLTGAATTTAAGVTTVVTTTAAGVSTAGVAAVGIGSAVGAYAGAVISAGIQTGSLDKALKAGENSLKGGIANIVVSTALAATGLSATAVGTTLDVGDKVGQAVVNTLTTSLSQSLAYGGSFGDSLITAGIGNAVTVISASAANAIGANKDSLGGFGVEIAHAGVGCAAGMARSGNSAGCGAGAAGAVVGHLGAGWVDSASGRTLSDADLVFWGQTIGSAGAALVGNSSQIEQNFSIGQTTAENAVVNNYLTTRQIEAKKTALDTAKTEEDSDAIKKKYDQLDKRQSEEAFNCVAKPDCVSVMEPGSIKLVLDDLNASCMPPRQCSVEALSGIRELNKYYGQAGAIDKIYPAEEILLGGVVGGKAMGTVLDAVSAVWAGARARLAGEVGAKGGVGATANKSPVTHQPLDDLLTQANKPINETGLSQTARAWDKRDTSRPGGTFDPLKGNAQ